MTNTKLRKHQDMTTNIYKGLHLLRKDITFHCFIMCYSFMFSLRNSYVFITTDD